MRSCGQNQKGIRYKNTKKTLLICFRENFITLFSLTDFQDFPGPALLFQDFPVLENAIIKFQDFPGFPGPLRTLRYDKSWSQIQKIYFIVNYVNYEQCELLFLCILYLCILQCLLDHQVFSFSFVTWTSFCCFKYCQAWRIHIK